MDQSVCINRLARYMISNTVLILFMVTSTLSGYARIADSSSNKVFGEIYGVNYVYENREELYDAIYNLTGEWDSIRLFYTGYNWISIPVYIVYDKEGLEIAYRVYGRDYLESLARLIELFKDNGFRVNLYVAPLAQANTLDYEAFIEEYTKLAYRIALFSRENGVDLLTLYTPIDRSRYCIASGFNKIVETVRNVYDGVLSISLSIDTILDGNTSIIYCIKDSIESIDLIQVTIDTINYRIHQRISRVVSVLESMYSSYGREIVVNIGSIGGDLSYATRFYKILFDKLYKKPWFKGLFFYSVKPGLVSNPCITGSSLEGFIVENIGGYIPMGYTVLFDPDNKSIAMLRYSFGENYCINNSVRISVVEEIRVYSDSVYLLRTTLSTNKGFIETYIWFNKSSRAMVIGSSLGVSKEVYRLRSITNKWINYTIVVSNNVDNMSVELYIDGGYAGSLTLLGTRAYCLESIVIGLYKGFYGAGVLYVDELVVSIDKHIVYSIDYSYWIGGSFRDNVVLKGGASIESILYGYQIQVSEHYLAPYTIVIVLFLFNLYRWFKTIPLRLSIYS